MDQMCKEGKTLYEFIKEKNIKKLEKLVKQCISWIGDTQCRNTTFPLVEWMLDKVVTYVGEYGEQAKSMDIVNDIRFEEMRKCVVLIDESRLEKCLPGFYQALTDVILYEKPTKRITSKKKDLKCLQQVFSHCKPYSKRMIEEKIENVFGFCIKITKKSEIAGCQSERPVARRPSGTRKCTPEEVIQILNSARECFKMKVREYREKNSKLTVNRVLKLISECMEKKKNCDMQSSDDLLKTLSIVLTEAAIMVYDDKKKFQDDDNTQSHCGPLCDLTGGTCNEGNGLCKCPQGRSFKENIGCVENECLDSLNSKAFIQCLKSVNGALPEVNQLQNSDNLIKRLQKCFSSALKGCSREEKEKIFKIFIRQICKKCNIPKFEEVDEYMGFAFSSVAITPTGVDICGNVFRTEEPPTKPNVKDDCIPVGDKKDQLQVRVPACRDNKVDDWLKKIKECVENKVTNIGLRNPDYLTLEKVVVILKECISNLGELQCRPKHREDFKKVMRNLFQLVTTNILAETDKKIRNALTYDKMGNKCKSLLYKYLTFDTNSEQLKRSQSKALECLQKCAKGVSNEVLEDLLDVLELAMVMDIEKIQKLFKKGIFQKCQVYEKPASDRVRFYNVPSYLNCGPGGMLVRKKKDVDNELYETSIFMRSISTEMSPLLRIKRADRQCITDDYSQYFEQLQECGWKRLRLKFRRKRNKCKLNDLTHSWTALVDCMIENIGGELTCQVTTEEGMTEFLQYAARTLHRSLQNIDDSCPTQSKCYGTEAPALFTCSNRYLELLKAKDATVPIRNIFDGSLKVLECLDPIWPNCPTEVQFSALNFLYLPLGLNYDNSLHQGLSLISCKDEPSDRSPSYPQCKGEEGENETGQDLPSRSFESCINCVKKKDGICTTESDIDLINLLERELSRINRCLKKFIIDDNCLKDMTTRISDKCFPEFYRLYKNISKGIILNSVEYFRKFNKCLLDFKNECPESYKKFTFHLYYDVLGLSSVFKPQFSYDKDPPR